MLAVHLGPALDEHFLDAGFAAAAFVVERHDLVADGRFHPGPGRKRRMHRAEIEARGRLDVVDHIGVVLGVEAGKLDLDAVGADLTDDGLGDAEGVDAGLDDVDRLADFFLPREVIVLVGRAVDRFERDRDAAGEIEAELEAALRLAEKLVQEDVVALLDILERVLEPDFREERREVEFALLADLLESDKFAGGLAGGFAGSGFVKELGEFRRLHRRVRFRVDDEVRVFQGKKFRHAPRRDGEGEQNLPEVAFEHVSIGLKRMGRGPRAAGQTGGDARRGAGYFLSAAIFFTTACTNSLPISTLVLSAMRTTKRSSFTFVMVP